MRLFNIALARLIFLGVFSISSFYATADICPPDWNHTVRYYVDGACSLEVDICYLCDPTGANPTQVLVAGWKQTGNCDNIDFDKDYWMNLFINDFLAFCTPPTCDGHSCLQFVVESPACLNWIYTNQPPPVGFSVWKVPCATSSKFCQVTTQVCRDPFTGLVIECPGTSRTYSSYGTACPTPIAPPSLPLPYGTNVLYGTCSAGDRCP